MINSIIEKQLIEIGNVEAKDAKKLFDSESVENVIKQAVVGIADYTEEMCHFTSVSVTERLPIHGYYTNKTEVSSEGKLWSKVIEKTVEISSKSPYVYIPLDCINNLGRIQPHNTQRDYNLSKIADNILTSYKTMIRKSVIDILRENSTKIDVMSLDVFFPESISNITKQLFYSSSYDVEQNILFVVTPKVYYLFRNFLRKNNIYHDMESILVDCWSEKDYCIVAGQSDVLSYGNINRINRTPVRTFIQNPIAVKKATDPNTGKPTLAIGADIAFIKDENISEIAYRLEF